MNGFPFAATTPVSIGRVGLKARDARMLAAFYADILGLEEMKRSKDKIDIVLCDVNMPEMDGLEMVRLVHLEDDLKGIPILMLTTEASKASKEIGKDAGVVAWITKPFKSEKVISAVQRVLKRRKKA